MNKFKFITSFLILILIIYACGGSYYEGKRDKKNDTGKLITVATLTGTGDKVIMEQLKEGLAIFESSSINGTESSSNFIVWLKDSDGNKLNIIANTLDGNTSSSSINISKDGTYLIEVNSKVSWTIVVKQNR